MADVEVFVWHDRYGNITGVGHVVAGHAAKVEPLARPTEQVLKLRIDQELLANLHLTQTVDTNKRILSRRPPKNQNDEVASDRGLGC